MAKPHEEPQDPLTPPIETEADQDAANLKGLVKGVVGAVPALGPLAAEFLEGYVRLPIERRREAWFTAVYESIRRLEAEGRVVQESLRENDEFLDVLYQASAIAIHTSDAEKLRALRNLVLRAAVSQDLDSAILSMILRIASECSGLQFEVLRDLWGSGNNSRSLTVELGDIEDERLIQIADDLMSKGLLYQPEKLKPQLKFTKRFELFMGQIADLDLEEPEEPQG